jgi:UDP-N-acetylglucosamine--N-acetylmuramyl-(pentapeptide) pyrophosphoryl-undecaprenol N-acetylglucosamine transferase
MMTPWNTERSTGFQKDGPLRVVIAGGGTGGHVFPGIALAQAFMSRNSESRILFVGTGNPFERRVFSATPFSHTAIPAEGIKGRGVLQKLRAVAKVPLGVFVAMGILRRFGAQVLVGVGGYSSAPVVMGAWLMGIPIILQEQNLVPGMANRLLARLSRQIHVSFAQTRIGFDTQKIRVSGNPVREAFVTVSAKPTPPMAKEAVEDRFTVLVCGGSQGAHAINQAVVEALSYLKENKRLFLIHQTGAADEADVRAAQKTHGIGGRTADFYVDMAAQYADADLVICRAGATTVAELTALGKPALLIPYPHAADQHQLLNAKLLANAGAAEMIPEPALNGRILADRILFLADHPDCLMQMAARSRALGRPQAAADIVDDCYALLTGSGRAAQKTTD